MLYMALDTLSKLGWKEGRAEELSGLVGSPNPTFGREAGKERGLNSRLGAPRKPT